MYNGLQVGEKDKLFGWSEGKRVPEKTRRCLRILRGDLLRCISLRLLPLPPDPARIYLGACTLRGHAPAGGVRMIHLGLLVCYTGNLYPCLCRIFAQPSLTHTSTYSLILNCRTDTDLRPLDLIWMLRGSKFFFFFAARHLYYGSIINSLG